MVAQIGAGTSYSDTSAVKHGRSRTVIWRRYAVTSSRRAHRDTNPPTACNDTLLRGRGDEMDVMMKRLRANSAEHRLLFPWHTLRLQRYSSRVYLHNRLWHCIDAHGRSGTVLGMASTPVGIANPTLPCSLLPPADGALMYSPVSPNDVTEMRFGTIFCGVIRWSR